MKGFLLKEYRFLQKPLSWPSRILLVIGAILVAIAIFKPLWQVELWAPQYDEGLTMVVYPSKIVGGNEGQDLIEINMLNHYIGMKTISEGDFIEMQVMPFMFGLFILLSLRAAVFGYMGAVIDLFVLAGYFGMYSIGAFYWRMHTYGHNLDPTAPMNVEPFTPVVIGTQKIANFVQTSMPQQATFFLCGFMICLMGAIWFSRNKTASAE